MALCDLLKNTIHERRDDSEHQSIRRKRQIPMLLFEDKHLEQVDNLVKATAAPQVNRRIEEVSFKNSVYSNNIYHI
jgi:hypothetical protein